MKPLFLPHYVDNAGTLRIWQQSQKHLLQFRKGFLHTVFNMLVFNLFWALRLYFFHIKSNALIQL